VAAGVAAGVGAGVGVGGWRGGKGRGGGQAGEMFYSWAFICASVEKCIWSRPGLVAWALWSGCAGMAVLQAAAGRMQTGGRAHEGPPRVSSISTERREGGGLSVSGWEQEHSSCAMHGPNARPPPVPTPPRCRACFVASPGTKRCARRAGAPPRAAAAQSTITSWTCP
jgi:hypothetical protein